MSITRGLESYLSKISHVELLKAVHYLAFLEHFPQTPLEKLFQQDTLDLLLQKGSYLFSFCSLSSPEWNCDESVFCVLIGRKAGKIQNWLQSLDLCLRLDKPHLASSLASIPNLQITPPAQEISVNQEVLSAVRGIVGDDAVQEGVLEQGVYFIGKLAVGGSAVYWLA